MSVVYLGGFGRSGSTLVERVLGAVPGWVNVGEVVDLARSVAPHDELCGCGEPFSRCPVWTEVGQVAFGGWTPEVLDRISSAHRAAARQRHLPGLLPGLPHRRRVPSDALRSLRADYAALYRAVAEVTGSAVVVDASKGPALGQALAGAPGIDLHVLNVVRDPRAVAWSWQREVSRPQDASGQEQMWRIPAHRAAAQWAGLQLEMASIARWGGVPSARLRYEDFVADPTGSLVAATAALGLPLAPEQLPAVDDGAILLEPSHGLSGNPSRFRSGVVRLRRDEAWTSEMPAAARAVVTGLTLPLLVDYGYATPRPATRPAPAVAGVGRTRQEDVT